LPVAGVVAGSVGGLRAEGERASGIESGLVGVGVLTGPRHAGHGLVAGFGVGGKAVAQKEAGEKDEVRGNDG